MIMQLERDRCGLKECENKDTNTVGQEGREGGRRNRKHICLIHSYSAHTRMGDNRQTWEVQGARCDCDWPGETLHCCECNGIIEFGDEANIAQILFNYDFCPTMRCYQNMIHRPAPAPPHHTTLHFIKNSSVFLHKSTTKKLVAKLSNISRYRKPGKTMSQNCLNIALTW